jgi:chemotaxis protein CheX
MSKDYLAPFADAAQQTLKLLLDVDALVAAQAGNDTVEGTTEEDGQVGVVIGITGDLNGEVRYSFPPDTSLEIVKMMSGMEFTEIDEFVISALGEIANIISGNAVTGLSGENIICDILPPKIGEGMESPATDATTYLFSTKLNSAIGDVDIKLQLKTNS